MKTCTIVHSLIYSSNYRYPNLIKHFEQFRNTKQILSQFGQKIKVMQSQMSNQINHCPTGHVLHKTEDDKFP